MTREEIKELKGLAASMGLYDDKNPCKRAVILGKAIETMEQASCEDAISRKAVIVACAQSINLFEAMYRIEELKPITPQPKTGYISIDDVMSVFDDFMCGEVDEDGTDTFLKMLKDKAESEE